MSLLSPLSLLWLGLLLPLVLLYILKRRRQERLVASTLLWEQALRDMRAERPWRRLIPHLSLLLQALALLLGALALSRPVGAGGLPSGSAIALVVDTSASMGARDPRAQSRLELARREGAAISSSLPPGGRAMIVQAGPEPQVLTPLTADGAALERGLDALELGGGSADLEAALSLASERLRGAAEGSRILLFTDGAQDGRLRIDGYHAPIELRTLGGVSLSNTAILSLDVRARPSAERPDRADVFVRVARFADTAAEVHITASSDAGALLSSRRVRLEAGARESVVMSVDLPPDASGRAPFVIARIDETGQEPAARAPDALDLDDLAVAASPGGRRLPVILIGATPRSIERALASDPEVELFRAELAALARREAQGEPPLDGYFVYTGVLPEHAPSGDSLVVAPEGERAFEASLGASLEYPGIVSWDELDPRMRFLSLTDLHLSTLRPIAPETGRALLTTQGGAAISVLERPDGETTLLGFDPDRSDWPRRPSFVVFIRNLLERVRDRRAQGGIAAGGLGESLRVPAQEGETIVVHTPSGRRVEGRARGDLALIPVGPEPGIYRIESEGRTRYALRNLLDAAESDLSPRLELLRSGRRVDAEASAPEDHEEAWPLLAGLLLLALVLEGIWATRRRAL
ncbi:MAG: VWA domain-containing protein [Myxococcales bacterium]|nr:VWA domain-containing protein [Myxococcales bacterium]